MVPAKVSEDYGLGYIYGVFFCLPISLAFSRPIAFSLAFPHAFSSLACQCRKIVSFGLARFRLPISQRFLAHSEIVGVGFLAFDFPGNCVGWSKATISAKF